MLSYAQINVLLQTSTPLKSEESITEQLKNYIDEVDEVLYKETGIRITTPSPTKQPIIIDVDKAENISSNKKHKLNFGLGKKLKSLTQKRQKTESDKDNRKNGVVSNKRDVPDLVVSEETPDIEFEEETQLSNQSPVMIHSSQQPAEKPPLTKGMLFHSFNTSWKCFH